ncbi:MAG: hypothetical protein ACOX6Y_04350 [Christensenellales bacterium]
MKTHESTPLQGSNVTFNHRTYVGEHGEVLYDMPLDAEDIDLNDFNATAKDLVTLRYNGTDSIRVLFVKTDNLELAKYQWSYIDEKHNQKMRDSRCMVPGCERHDYLPEEEQLQLLSVREEAGREGAPYDQLGRLHRQGLRTCDGCFRRDAGNPGHRDRRGQGADERKGSPNLAGLRHEGDLRRIG